MKTRMTSHKLLSTLGASLAALLLASGCTTSASWAIRFRSASDREATRAVEARVRQGGCDGAIVFATELSRDDDGMPAPSLESGVYGVEAVARDADCNIVARACVLVTIPRRGDVLLDLESVAPVLDCPPGECSDGRCRTLDAGTDAGLVDGGRLDAQETGLLRDTGEQLDAPALDAGPDAFSAEDAPSLTDAFIGADAFVPLPPRLLAPWNGFATGTSRAVDPDLADPPRRPLVRWEESPGAQSYVLEWVACSEHDLTLCSFDAPDARAVVDDLTLEARPASDLAVETATPVGRRYAFRVGACALPAGVACAFGEPRYLDVGRMVQDLDGDGDGEMVVTRNTTVEALGGAATTPASTVTLATGTTLTNTAYAGDYDANGTHEIVINVGGATGRWELRDDTGAVLGGQDGAAATDLLGRPLAGLGDVDGDGYADFAVGAPGIDEVRIYFGGASFDVARSAVLGGDGSLSDFGIEVSTAGDRDLDGLVDVAVASRISVGMARIEIFSLAGRTARRLDSQDVSTGETDPSTNPPPVSLAGGGDLDGDARADLGIGLGIRSEVLVWLGSGTTGVVSLSGEFGRSVAMGDLAGSGLARMVIGAPRYITTGWGETGTYAHMTYLGAPLVTTIGFVNREAFGTHVGAADLDGDGREEMFTISGTAVVGHIGTFAGGMIGGGATFRFLFSNPVRWLAR